MRCAFYGLGAKGDEKLDVLVIFLDFQCFDYFKASLQFFISP